MDIMGQPDWVWAAAKSAGEWFNSLDNTPPGEDKADIKFTQCPHCQGTGVDPNSNNGEKDCLKCEGAGELPL